MTPDGGFDVFTGMSPICSDTKEGEPQYMRYEQYAMVKDWVNPPAPPFGWQVPLLGGLVFLVQAAQRIKQYGFFTLKQAIAGGQYRFKHCLFYGLRNVGPSKVDPR